MDAPASSFLGFLGSYEVFPDARGFNGVLDETTAAMPVDRTSGPRVQHAIDRPTIARESVVSALAKRRSLLDLFRDNRKRTPSRH